MAPVPPPAPSPSTSQHTSCTLRSGEITDQISLAIASRIKEGGVLFADGMEQDFLRFDWGTKARLSLAEEKLNLVVCPSAACVPQAQ